MKPISRDELKRRMLQFGGISPDDAENAAVMELFDEIDRLRGEQQTPQWREQGRSGDCLTCVHKMKDWQMDPCRECDGQNYSRATLPVPSEVTVEARVEGE